MATAPFLTYYYAQVRKIVGDPAHGKRFTDADLYDELLSVDQEIFEGLLNAAGMESLLGYAEATIVLQDGEKNYRLPPACRQFISLKRFDDSSGEYLNELRSQPPYSTEYGPQLLSSSHGFMMNPAPKLDSNQNWTLEYLRGPGKTFYIVADSYDTSANTVTITSSPGTDAGTYVREDDYYNGCLMSIYAEAATALGYSIPFVSPISDFAASTGVFTLQDQMPLFTGANITVELLPCLPEPYFKLHCFDTALRFISTRTQPDQFALVQGLRDKSWNAAKGWVLSNTMDRGPTKIRRIKPEDRVPTGETVWTYGA